MSTQLWPTSLRDTTVVASPVSSTRRIRLKKRLLAGAVAENISLINGTRYRSRSRRRSWLLISSLPIAFVLLITPVRSMLEGNPQLAAAIRPEVSASPAINSTPDIPVAPTPQPVTEQQYSFAAPQAIDPAVFRLEVRKVMVDPGHGGNDPGAMTAGSVKEKDLTLDLALRVQHLLIENGMEVAMTRDTDETVSLQQRVVLANAAKADLFISIHINFIPIVVRRGIETYYLGATTDPQIEKLARAENSGSGYSLADFRKLLEGVYTDIRQEESSRFAAAVQTKLFSSLRRLNPKLENRGVKQAPFVVLIGTAMPGILAEVSCMNNRDEVRLLRESNYRQTIAEALAAGVRGYAGRRHFATATTEHRTKAAP
jgi:N-acetylmuramoyl-L-alanine amidase